MSKTVKLDVAEQQETENKELVKVERVDDTPFSIVETDGKYFLALGKYRLTELSEDKAEILESVNDTSWERLLALMHAVATEVINEGKEKK